MARPRFAPRSPLRPPHRSRRVDPLTFPSRRVGPLPAPTRRTGPHHSSSHHSSSFPAGPHTSSSLQASPLNPFFSGRRFPPPQSFTNGVLGPQPPPKAILGPQTGPQAVRGPRSEYRVRQGFTFKDAILSPPSGLSPPSFQRSTRPLSSLPSKPPKFLLNPSLRGRCFRCFQRGHRAASCRDPRRCLLCMRIGHSGARCGFPPRPTRRLLDPVSSSGRPIFSEAFLPSRPPPPGHPPLSGCVALAEVLSPFVGNANLVLS